MTDRIRVTGGNRLNRKLISPPKDTIRPASDMIRQAVFNMIGDTIEGAVFYDIFAGTGVVGIEAISRGAKKAIFCELDRRFVQLIRKNLTLAKIGPEASVRPGDAFIWAKHFVPEPGVSIVFLGPPYPLCMGKDQAGLFEMVAEVQGKLDADDWLVLQFPSDVDPALLPDAEHWVRMRHYGKTHLGIWRRDGKPGDPIWIVKEEDDDTDLPADNQNADGPEDES